MSRATLPHRGLLAAALACVLVAAAVPHAQADQPETWAADAAHTEIRFSVDHFFTPVNGRFEEFEIELDYNAEDPEQSSVEARIAVASLDTGNDKRDAHLRTPDWFEVERYPYMTFKSTSVRRVGDGQLIASGPLTIKGKSHQVELPITLIGKRPIPEPMQPMLGGTKEVASFRAATRIDRGDFEVGTGSWAATMVVGGEVDIEILLEAHNR